MVGLDLTPAFIFGLLTALALAVILKVARLYVVGKPSDYVEVPS